MIKNKPGRKAPERMIKMTIQEFIAEMKAIREEVTHGDMQGMVEAFAMQNGVDDDDILNQIYEVE